MNNKKNTKAPELDELPSAPEKKSVLRKAQAQEQAQGKEPGGPHGPDCKCHEMKYRVHISADVLVGTKEEVEMVAKAFDLVGLTLDMAGYPVRVRSDLYGKSGDDVRVEETSAPATPNPNLN